jgi:hypothetical protein
MNTEQYLEIISSPECLKTIYANELDLDKLFYLYSRFKGLGLTRYMPKELTKTLHSAGLLTAAGNLSKAGLDFVSSLIDVVTGITEEEREKEWLEFWEAVPETDAVRHLEMTRNMRSEEAKCKAEFFKLRQNGYTAAQMIDGMKNHVKSLMMRSIKRNELTYMKNPLRWLKEKDFEAWSKKTPANSTEGDEAKRIGNVL